MILKIVSFVFSNLLGSTFSNPDGTGQFFSNLTMLGFRKMILLSSGIFAGFLLFVGGFFTVLLDLVLTSREAQQLLLSQVSIIGFVLMSFSILSAAVLFRKQIWTLVPPKMEEPRAASITPVVEALAEMIRDMTEERRIARQRGMQSELQRNLEMASAQAGATNPLDFAEPPRPAYN